MRINFWNLKARFYDAVRRLPWMRQIFHEEMSKLACVIDSLPQPPAKVLDLGTGTGSSLRLFRGAPFIVGVDRSLNMIKRAHRKERLSVIVGEACRLPLRKGMAPFVSAVGLTEYLPDKHTFLDEVKRVMTPGGYFLVTISPPGFFNKLRNVSGNRLYCIRTEIWEDRLQKKGFVLVLKEKTFLQMQYLLRVEGSF